MVNGQPGGEIPRADQEGASPPSHTPLEQRTKQQSKERILPGKVRFNLGRTLLETPQIWSSSSHENDVRSGAPLTMYRTQLAINALVGYGIAYFQDTSIQLTLRGSTLRKAASDALGPEFIDTKMGNTNFEDWYGRINTLPDIVLKSDLQAKYRDGLQRLPAHMRQPFEHILISGSDLDIQLTRPNNTPDASTATLQKQFAKDISTTLLPYFTNAVASDVYRTHPATAMTAMQELARQKNQSPSEPNELPPGVISLTNNVENGDYIAVLDRQITLKPIGENQSSQDFDKTVIYAKRIPIRDGKITVTQITIAADRRTDPTQILTMDNIEQLTQPAAVIQFNSTFATEEEVRRGSSRVSPAATSRDRTLVPLEIGTSGDNKNRTDIPALYTTFREVGQVETAPQIEAELTQDVLKTFNGPVTLGPDWGHELDEQDQPLRNPVDDLEIASRALWQSIHAGIYETNVTQPRDYITSNTLNDISKFIDTHSNLLSQLTTDQYSYQRGMIQDELLLMFMHNPHQGLRLIQESGFGRLLFPTLSGNALEEHLSRLRLQLDEKISEDDYRVATFGKRRSLLDASVAIGTEKIEDLDRLLERYGADAVKATQLDRDQHERLQRLGTVPDGWQLIHSILFSDTQDLTTILSDLYTFTNIGYNLSS